MMPGTIQTDEPEQTYSPAKLEVIWDHHDRELRLMIGILALFDAAQLEPNRRAKVLEYVASRFEAAS